jgi:murein DD-endopeptidase MepM/ murein hydrolase activator NlpD
MIVWRRWQNRGDTPGLSANHALGLAADHRFESDPHPVSARRPIDAKWLAALLLMGTTAIVLLGMVWTSLGSGLSGAMAPVFFRRPAEGNDSPRADRLMSLARPREPGVIRSHIEQLADDVQGTKAFTYVRVLLADAAGHGAQPVAARAPGRVAHMPRHANVAAAIAADASLPPEIRFGASRPPLPAHATAYADDDTSQVPTLPGVPINLSVIAKSASVAASERHVIVARDGDTMESILTALGVTAQDAGAIAALLTPRSWFGRNSFAGGEIVTVLQGSAQDQARPSEVTLARDGKTERAAALSDNGTYVTAAPHAAVAKVAPEPNDNDVALRPAFDPSGMKLDESLGRLAQENRIAPSLVNEVVQQCVQDTDLQTAISPDDTAQLLYTPNAEGKPQLAFAALTLDGHAHRCYRFTAPDDGSTDYYDAKGYSITGSLMKRPVADGRLGDGFGWRIHPILHDRRFHEGVDYAAPFGSPIEAAGAGVVEKIDQEWGYGKYVRIRHDFGYETTYAHLSGVPHGLKIGERVRAGQTIGYVGSTGLSTGPHLYYELRVDGRYADPLRAHLHAGRVLEGDALAAFQKMRARTDMLLKASARSAALE